MEVKFNNDDFDFYRSGVMVLERLKNGFSVVSFVFSYFWVWIHITIRRVTVLIYPKFMYLVLMLYLLFSLGFCLMLSPFLCVCVLHFNVVSLFCSYIWCVSLSLICNPDFVFCPWIYEFWTAVYYCCLYLCSKIWFDTVGSINIVRELHFKQIVFDRIP